MATKTGRPDPWGLRAQVRRGEGLIVLGYLAGMAATAATSQAVRGNNDDRLIFPLWALAFVAATFWLFRAGTRRGVGRPWGVIPLVMVWGLVNAGHNNVPGWAGWLLGLVGLIATNLIRLVAETFQQPLARSGHMETGSASPGSA